ncbi:MAG TPA: hypothetical protein VGP25_08820 [Gemmatimonadaceae bacterium]|nr:hypothetical protein [Gemmatimonadaceae bacterium]
MGTISFWGTVLYLGLRFVRAAERRGASPAELEELRARVARLEEDLETTRSETERLAAAEQHTMMLLSRRLDAGTRTS